MGRLVGSLTCTNPLTPYFSGHTRSLPLANNAETKKTVYMKIKLAIVAALAAGFVSGSGVALADDPAPAPDPNGPKCYTPTEDGWMHTQLVPCGWTYSQANGWQQLPPPPKP